MTGGFIRAKLLLLGIMAGAVLGQTGAGRIQGTVKDSSGAVIPKANVVAEHVETGTSFQTVTNGAGFFIFSSTQTGRYRVTVQAPGLERWQGELQLQTGQDAVIEPVLAVGATTAQINVADVTPLINTTNASLATVVERQRIEELPLNGRFVQNLIAQTTPGLEGGAGTPKPYGLREGSLTFVQDGVPINDANVSQLTTRPPGLDTVQEYRVEMSVASARYTSPATTLLTTRSGTNLLHGSVFYTGRNNGFGVARRREDFYTKPPQLIRNSRTTASSARFRSGSTLPGRAGAGPFGKTPVGPPRQPHQTAPQKPNQAGP